MFHDFRKCSNGNVASLVAMPKRKHSDDASGSFARLDVFARGMIWGMHVAKAPREDICKEVVKKDRRPPSMQAVDQVIAHMKAFPDWRGEDSKAGGRPGKLTAGQKKEVVGLVFRERGQAKVTVSYCRKRLFFLRRVSRQTVVRALQAAGLAWFRRRMKTLVPQAIKVARVEYAEWILGRHQTTLDRFAYVDGTTFYLARGSADHEQKQRAALGSHVWRMSNGKDGLWADNVGPSLYSKAQGLPVKIWGFFANGILQYYVLPKDGARTTNMNGDRYEWLIGKHFSAWRRTCFEDDLPVHVVQDHERCLWQDRNVRALRAAGCLLVTQHTKYSPDLNAIEGQWHILRARLDITAPVEIESRKEFIARLRTTVTWLNTNRWEDALALCVNQKQRARDLVFLDGAKTKW